MLTQLKTYYNVRMRKVLIFGIPSLFVLIVGSVFVLLMPKEQVIPIPPVVTIEKVEESETSIDVGSTTVWILEDAGVSESDGSPKTIVRLNTNGNSYDLGTYQGTCSEIKDSAWELLPNEQSGVICWFAEGGTEIAVFSEQNNLIVKRGELEESGEGSEGLRGNFKELFPLKI